MNNGDGLRVVLWLSGCNHRCKGCQNPQTWDVNSGVPFDEKAKEELFRELDKDYISGLTLSGGDALHEANLDGVLDIVTEFNKRYRTAQDIVLDKGDNHNMLNENPDRFRLLMPEKTIWIYTGYKLKFNEWFADKQPFSFSPKQNDGEGLMNDFIRCEIVKSIDVLVDGQYIDSQRNISAKWRGSDNQRVIDVQESLKKGEIVLWCD